MRPKVITLSAAGVSAPIPVNNEQANFKITLQAVVSGGAVLTYSVQNTADDPFRRDYPTDFNTDGNWFDTTGLAALTTSAQGNIFFPVRAVRLNITAHTSGSVTLTILQATDKWA